MKSFSAKCFVALAVFACAAFALRADAQNEGKKGKKGGDPTAQMTKRLEAAELTDDQKAKYEAIAKDHGAKIKEAQAKLSALLTPEQLKAKSEAQQAAKAAGKKGKEANDMVNDALKLTEDQQKRMAEAEKEVKDSQAAFAKAVTEILTDEQKEKAKIGGKKKNK